MRFRPGVASPFNGASHRIHSMFSERTNWRLARNPFTQAVEEMRAQGAHLLDLTVSNPTRVGLDYDGKAILGAMQSERALDYDPQAKGSLTAREAVAGYYESEHGIHGLDPERIVLTTSTSEGYSYIFRLLCNAGDELLVPKPSYPLFEFLADLQDVRLVPYPLIYDHGWQMDFHSLERAVTGRTRGVVVVHPNNPTGSYVHAVELGPLNEFCRTHGLALIVDEVFLDYEVGTSGANVSALNPTADCSAGSAAATEKTVELRSAGQPGATVPTYPGAAPSFVSNHDVLTFTLSGLSKVSALPQMKVAWIATSGPAVQVESALARLEVIADTYLSMNAPVQWAVPVMLEQRKNIQRQLLARVRANLSELDRQLAGQRLCQRLSIEGGWYAVVRVPVTRSDEELCIDLVRKTSVIAHPGHFYDFESDGYLVLSLITELQIFAAGCQRMLDHLNR